MKGGVVRPDFCRSLYFGCAYRPRLRNLHEPDCMNKDRCFEAKISNFVFLPEQM
jgi:hypothetical protein